MSQTRKNYYVVDLAKFVMAILVVAIHVRPFQGELAFAYDDIIARIADPLFFSITAFLFFEKVFADQTLQKNHLRETMTWGMLGHYMKRILQLYTAWFLIYSPVVIVRTYREMGDVQGMKMVLKMIAAILQKFWLSGYYGAMWFMTALLLAMPLTFFATKYAGPRVCVVLSAPWFLLTVMRMEYCRVTDAWTICQQADKVIGGIFGWYGNGLTYGFFFCALGMWIAWKRKERQEAGKTIDDGRKSGIAFMVCFLLLVIESYVIRIENLGQSFGAMFFLIPTSYFLLLWLLSSRWKVGMEKSKQKRFKSVCTHLRKLSILIFTIHYGVMEALQFWGAKLAGYAWDTTALYLVVLLLTMGIAELILWLEKRIKWMRILH